MIVRVVGMKAGGRGNIVHLIGEGDPALLVREPDNPHDRHAVAVHTAPAPLMQDPWEPGGTLSDRDRRVLADRHAGYLQAELAVRVDIPDPGVLGVIHTVRYKPDTYEPAGFDVLADLALRRDRPTSTYLTRRTIAAVSQYDDYGYGG